LSRGADDMCQRPYLAVCLCFKDSAAYLEEWLLFHYVQGFRRFYLYNNESSDGWRRVVAPWVADGLVECFDYPGLGVQHQIYEDCLARARHRVTWLAFLDDDEFLYPTGSISLSASLSSYERHAGVAVPWVLFGSGGVVRQTDEWVIRRFQLSAGAPDNHLKCIVRPDRIVRPLVIGHSFEPVPGYQVVDENENVVAAALHPAPSIRTFRINHYIMKSWQEFRFRRSRPQANTGRVKPHSDAAWREWDGSWSAVRDASALSFVAEMEELQNRRRRLLARIRRAVRKLSARAFPSRRD